MDYHTYTHIANNTFSNKQKKKKNGIELSINTIETDYIVLNVKTNKQTEQRCITYE